MKTILKTVFEGNRLSRSEASAAMHLILAGSARPEQIAAFLAALAVRRETVEELAGFLEAMRAKAVTVTPRRSDVFDTCGTGGDNAQTFNISTAAALVVAGAGVPVAKHGNRSVSSRAGSADVLEALGVPLDLAPERVASRIDESGFGFLFAPRFHPALAVVAPVRKAMEVRTVFNLLGPLANPARVKRQLVGVYSPRLLSTFAELLRETGTEEALVVSASDGMDELSLSSVTLAARLHAGQISFHELSPKDFGLNYAPREALRGGDAGENARDIERILTGAEKGPKRDVVVMNAAASLVVAGVAAHFAEGAAVAREVIASGRAARVLEAAKRGGKS